MNRTVQRSTGSETSSAPVSGNQSSSGASVRKSSAHDIRPATILLVDDDDDLRYVTEMVLRMKGCYVIPCNDAKSASTAFRDAPFISLLVTDMQMPERSGIELARELTALRPSLLVLIVSGRMPPRETQVEIRDRRWAFLNKTGDDLALLNTVADLMN